jgi:hypothetical protein
LLDEVPALTMVKKELDINQEGRRRRSWISGT